MWVAGEYPAPSWIVEQNDWIIQYDRVDGTLYFEKRGAAENGTSEVWLVIPGEVIKWTNGSWFFGEVQAQ